MLNGAATMDIMVEGGRLDKGTGAEISGVVGADTVRVPLVNATMLVAIRVGIPHNARQLIPDSGGA